MNISIKRQISIIGIGSVSTLLILLMIEALFAQILVDTILDNIDNNLMLLIIISGLFIFTLIISDIIGIFIARDLSRSSIYSASVLGIECLFLFLFVSSNGYFFIFHTEVYSNIHGFEIFPIFPMVIINFGIYALGEVFYVFIYMIISYYIFFVFFLDKLNRGKELNE